MSYRSSRLLAALVIMGAIATFVGSTAGASSRTSGASAPSHRATGGAEAAPGPSSKGADVTYSCSGAETELFNNWNTDAVSNGGTAPEFSTDGHAYCLVQLDTYHWNGGNGASPAGTISLMGETGTLGPYQAVATAGAAPNVNWQATVGTSPPVVIDGTYEVEDSQPSTWSQDSASDGLGFTEVWVEEATETTSETTTSTTPTTTSTRGTTTSTRPTTTSTVPPTTTTTAAPTTTTLPRVTTGPTRPCQCEDLSVENSIPEARTFRDNKVFGEINGVEYPVVLKVALVLRLRCTGGTGRCKSKFTVFPPAGWTLRYLGFDPSGESNGVTGPRAGTGPPTDALTVTCSKECNAPQTLKVYFMASTDATGSGAHVWTFESQCSGTLTMQFWVVVYGSNGKILFGPTHQHLSGGGGIVVRPVAPPPPSPCHCTSLTVGPPGRVQLTAGSTKGFAGSPAVAFTQITVLVPYVLWCSGGDGKCSGELAAEGPPGWFASDWYQVDHVRLPSGAVVNKVGKAVGGLEGDLESPELPVSCVGPCGGKTAGAFYLRSRINSELSSTTVTFKLHLTCPEGVTLTDDLNISFSKSGSVVQSATTITPA